MLEPEFRINDYIMLKLEGRDTILYVGGREFSICKYLLLEIPFSKFSEINDIKSIDDAEAHLDGVLEGKEDVIPPEVEFWGHCSNLQVWAEYNYDTRLLHRDLAFPLLKKLVALGDQQAKDVFDEEVIKRYIEGNETVRRYLQIEGYLWNLSRDRKPLLLEDNEALALLELEKMTDAEGYWVNRQEELAYTNTVFELMYFVKGRHIIKLKLQDYESDVFPEPIKELSYLEELTIINSKIKEIPELIGDLKCLQELNLSQNDIHLVPSTIGNLTNLKKLDLSYNKLTSLPTTFERLTSLEYLSLYRNEIKNALNVIKNLNSSLKFNI